MRTCLHITNGDGAAGLLKSARLEGDVLPWRDPMHHGPFPAGADLEALSTVRGRYLAGPDLPEADVVRDFALRNEHLKSASLYEEVVLWFEHDLLDQLQILQILDAISTGFAKPRALSMICIDRFAGIDDFRGLGQLSCDQIKSLWPQRKTVSADQFDLAREGWAAFRSDDPRDVERFLQQDLSPLPFLADALRRQLEEFPYEDTGLTRTEAQLLGLVAQGVRGPVALFLQNMDLETVLYMGDWTTFRRLDLLCAGSSPLLRCAPQPTFLYPPSETLSREAFAAQRLTLTDQGRQVQDGTASAAGLIERDEWLGGVHLNSGEPMWMWHEGKGHLTRKDG